MCSFGNSLTCFECICSGIFWRLSVVLRVVEDADGVAVGDDVPVEAPVATNRVAEEVRVSAGRDSVHLVVGTHDASHLPFRNTSLEGHIEGVFQVLLAYLIKSLKKEIRGNIYLID